MDLNNLKSEPIVVIGGGFGGISTVIGLLAKSKQAPIILIDQSSRFLFKPLLYELLSDELQLWEIAPRYSALSAELGFTFLQDSVVKIDEIERKLITASDFELKYSQLVISTGVKTDYSAVEGLKKYAYGFSNLNDLSRIKKLINKINNSSDYNNPLVISGAGPTGVELACKISDLVHDRIDIYLIDKGNKILRNCKSFNREKSIEALDKRNIKIYLHHFVESVNRDYLELSSTIDSINSLKKIHHSGLIWTSEVKPQSLKLIHHFMNGNQKIKVNEFLQINECKDIFFVGDIILNENKPFPASAQSAMQQGFVTAQNSAWVF